MEKYLDNLGVNASIIIQSHCSDAESEVLSNPTLVKVRLGFIKFMINKLNSNLDQYVNADLMWCDYINDYKIKF